VPLHDLDWLGAALDLAEEYANPITLAAQVLDVARAANEAGQLIVTQGRKELSWLDDAWAALGDVVDPFLPGFSGSETRGTSSSATLAIVNADRAAKGLPPLRHRHRRKRALTANDKADIAFIAGIVSKRAAGDFAMILGAK